MTARRKWSERRRQSYEARDYGGLTQREVAAALGLSRAGVQLIERRALSKLRAVLDAAPGDGLPPDR